MKLFRYILGLLLLTVSAQAATAITVTITFTNAANLAYGASNSGASITVNSDARRWTNTITSPGTQIPLTSTSGTNISQQVQLFLSHVAAHPLTSITPSSDGSTKVALQGATGLSMSVALIPTNYGYVTMSTQTVGTGYTLRLPITVETPTLQTNLANWISSALTLSSNQPSSQLGTSNSNVKPIRITAGLLSLQAGDAIGLGMTATSVVFNSTPIQLGTSNATVKPIVSGFSFRSLESGDNISLAATSTSLIVSATSAGSVPLGNSVWVSKTGSDSTGSRGSISTPFLTLTSAKTNAVAGDTIFVLPGTYNEGNLLKHSVNWHFFNGVIVTNTSGTTALLDDGGTNITSTITGDGILTSSASMQVVHASGSGTILFIKALKIFGGTPPILATSGTMTIEANEVSAPAGRPIDIDGSSSILTVNRTRLKSIDADPFGWAVVFLAVNNNSTFRDCVFVSNTKSFKVASVTANVRLYGSNMANMTNDAAVTFITGSTRFEVDTDVQ